MCGRIALTRWGAVMVRHWVAVMPRLFRVHCVSEDVDSGHVGKPTRNVMTDGSPASKSRYAWRGPMIGCAGLACWLLGMGWSPGYGQDVVIVQGRDGLPGATRKGEVLEYTGAWLTLKLPAGRELRIKSKNVVRLVTNRSETQQLAEGLFRQGKYAPALQRYRQAAREEKRSWIRREILARQVECFQNQGEMVAAAQRFLLILESDPTARCFDVIPLIWGSPGNLNALEENSGRQWLREATAVSRLIGSSWMLAMAERASAIDNLESLAASEDLRIAFLAEAQLWRIKLVTASREEVSGWERRIHMMPDSLRAGPYFLLGQGLARHNDPLGAALAFLRIPILHPNRQALVPDALWRAGQCLEAGGQQQDAALVYREVLAFGDELPTVSAARERLQQISNDRER